MFGKILDLFFLSELGFFLHLTLTPVDKPFKDLLDLLQLLLLFLRDKTDLATAPTFHGFILGLKSTHFSSIVYAFHILTPSVFIVREGVLLKEDVSLNLVFRLLRTLAAFIWRVRIFSQVPFIALWSGFVSFRIKFTGTLAVVVFLKVRLSFGVCRHLLRCFRILNLNVLFGFLQ